MDIFILSALILIPVVGLAFYYFIFWMGTKLLQITDVTKKQILVFTLANVGFSYILTMSFTASSLAPAQERGLDVLLWLVSASVAFIFVKYILKLSDRSLWMFWTYVIAVLAIFNTVLGLAL